MKKHTPRKGKKVKVLIGPKQYGVGKIIEVSRFFATILMEAGYKTTIHRSDWPEIEYVK